jgi:dephospho-CoA kinase
MTPTRRVHDLYDQGGAAVGPVGEAFPGVVKDGGVDREGPAPSGAGQPEALKRLNAIVHPLRRPDRSRLLPAGGAHGADIWWFWTSRSSSKPAATPMSTPVVVASAPADMQRERVLARPG